MKLKFQCFGSVCFFADLSAFSFIRDGGDIDEETKQKEEKGISGSPVVYRSADGIYHDNSKGTMLYVCSHYPECDAYVRVHAGTNIPVGSLARHELRTLRRTAHHYFDQLYQSGYMSKQDAYQWLADLICAPLSEAHIGYLGEYYCKRVIEESRRLLERQKAKQGWRRFQAVRGGVAV